MVAYLNRQILINPKQTLGSLPLALEYFLPVSNRSAKAMNQYEWVSCSHNGVLNFMALPIQISFSKELVDVSCWVVTVLLLRFVNYLFYNSIFFSGRALGIGQLLLQMLEIVWAERDFQFQLLLIPQGEDVVLTS